MAIGPNIGAVAGAPLLSAAPLRPMWVAVTAALAELIAGAVGSGGTIAVLARREAEIRGELP
jgi:hypothetical protein